MKLAASGQVVRRVTQFGVLAFIVYTALGGPFRNYKLAHNHRRIVGLIEGDFWAFLYGVNEDALSLLGEAYDASLAFLGMPWAGRFLWLDTADPLLVVNQLLHDPRPPLSLLLSALLPLLLALLFGKVFCSHLCPMRLFFELGALVRAGLSRLGVPLLHLRPSMRLGGFVLAGGLLASLSVGSAIWLLVLPYVSLGAGIFLSITAGGGIALLAVAGFWWLVDTTVAPGAFCHSLCPTGFALEQLGRASLLRLHKDGAEPCPEGCRVCVRTCPYGLSPREQTHRPACDNCGRCAAACPGQRLSRRFSLPVIAAGAVFCVLCGAAPAYAHHNKGLPHYGYFENYPQVPTEEYVTVQGRWEIGATIFNFQGMDRLNSDTPNDAKIYLYLYDLKSDVAYTGPLAVEIRRDGELVSRFDRVEVDEESVYSTRETLPASGDYELWAYVGNKRVTLPFQVELAGDGPDPLVLGGIAVPVLLLFVLALLGRSRRRRRRPAARTSAAAVVALLLVFGVCPPTVSASPEVAAASAGPSAGQGVVCPYCGMIDCPMDHSQTSGHGGMRHYALPGGGEVMVMGGIPLGLFLFGIAAVIGVSFAAVEWRGLRERRGFRRNLIANRRVYAFVRSRWFQAVPQLFMAAVLAFLIYVGLFGSRVANLAPVAVWTLWWAGLIFAVLLLGSTWCFVCPWDGLANLVSRLRLAARVEPLSLNLRYPKWLANMYPAIGLFVVLTWLELGYGVTTDPRLTAYMGLGMAALAIGSALLWEGKKFCAHLCPVGRICGIYSTFSPVEVRGRKAATCQVCRTEDCLHGNERGYPCPTGISLKVIQSSSLCTGCTECIKSCNKQNIAINLRPFGADLRAPFAPRTDEAWLALTLLSLTLFHGLSMTPAWESFAPGSMSILKWMGLHLGTPRTLNFTLAMAVAVAAPIGLYWLGCKLAAHLAGDATRARELFVAYAFSVLPIALFYHLAHNLMHLLMEGGAVVPLLSDPMGDGSDYFGTRGLHVGSLIGEQTLWYMQVGLIVIGHIYGIVVAHRIGHRLHPERRAARKSLVPVPMMMVALSICGLWLMNMDMNMRIGRM